MAIPALPMAPAGFFLFLLRDYSSLHILCGAGLLWNLLLSTSFTASSTPTLLRPPQVKVKHPLRALSNAAALVESSPIKHRNPSLLSAAATRSLSQFVIVSYWQITTLHSELSLRSSLRVKAAALRSSCETPASSSSSWGGRALCHRVKKWGQRSHAAGQNPVWHIRAFSPSLSFQNMLNSINLNFKKTFN